MNFLAFLLSAETPSGGEATPTGAGGGMLIWLIMIVAMIAMFWWSSRSQKKRDKEVQDMRESLQVGDEVTTIGGIIGKVVSIKEETFVLETTKEKTHIRFLKAAIRSVDVRIADITAAAAEAKEPEVQEQTAEEPSAKPAKKGLFKKKK